MNQNSRKGVGLPHGLSRGLPRFSGVLDPEEIDEEYEESEHDEASERPHVSGWAPLIVGGLALLGIAWWAGKAQAAPTPIPPKASPPPPQFPPAPSSQAAAQAAALGAAIAAAAAKQTPSATPAPQKPSGGSVKYLGDPISLQPGTRYRARLLLSGMETMAGPDMIAAQFKVLGFPDARVYMNASELPANWPRSTLGTAGGIRYLEGTYQGVATTMAKPSQIEKVWVA